MQIEDYLYEKISALIPIREETTVDEDFIVAVTHSIEDVRN